MSREKILVNPEKENRAQAILEVLGRSSKNDDEQEVKNKFSKLFADAGLEPKGDKALVFIYEKLGGLVRSEAEQKEHEEKVEALKSKKKK